MTTDSFGLERFLVAQQPVYESVCQELVQGKKVGHWIWFIFPQFHGLGWSPNAQFYALNSLEEAAAYLAHPVLGSRLQDCTRRVLGHGDKSLVAIFGHPDDLKFRSCMTLFSQLSEHENIFAQALMIFCQGQPDDLTLAILKNDAKSIS